jgi:hypothetical protein
LGEFYQVGLGLPLCVVDPELDQDADPSHCVPAWLYDRELSGELGPASAVTPDESCHPGVSTE